MNLNHHELGRIKTSHQKKININKFAGFSKELDNLSASIKDQIDSLIFTMREDIFSVNVIFRSKEPLEQILGFSLPHDLIKETSDRFFIDLESVNTNKIRVYVDNKEKNICGYGYYLNPLGEVLITKIYKKHSDKNRVMVDRYSHVGNIISRDEPEISCDKTKWTGPAKLVDIAAANNYFYHFMMKEDKNQVYLIVNPN